MKDPVICVLGREYSFVKERNYVPVSIYKGTNDFLRIGPKKLIQTEIEFHKNLLKQGFPVPEILEEGEHEGLAYFRERSVGELHFGQLFGADFKQEQKISEAHFESYLTLTEKYAEAQLRTAGEAFFDLSAYRTMIELDTLIEELPQLKVKTLTAFTKATQALQELPLVITHTDFNPYNIFEEGVIDWEHGTYASIGFDLVANVTQASFFPFKGDFEFMSGYRFSQEQTQKYYEVMDSLFEREGLPKLTTYRNAFIFSRFVWSVVRMERWPKIQAWRYAQYTALLDAFLADTDLSKLLRE